MPGKRQTPPKPGEVGAPIPGAVTIVHVEQGEKVAKGERLLVMEAMKMQTTVYAPIAGTVKRLAVSPRDNVEARDSIAHYRIVDERVERHVGA